MLQLGCVITVYMYGGVSWNIEVTVVAGWMYIVLNLLL